MLGLTRTPDRWQWAAYGKHPMAKDFFSLGEELPLSRNFLAWMQKGYGTLPAARTENPTNCSWRFWSRGTKKDVPICGLIRDSSDGIGRPYPLLLMGSGPLRGCEERWDLLSLACERTWSRMEYLSKRHYGNVKDFENDLLLLPPPEGDWEILRKEKEVRGQCPSPDDMVIMDEETLRTTAPGNGKRDFLFIDLQRISLAHRSCSVDVCHFSLKRLFKHSPNAVFMGGAPHSLFLAVYMRALSSEDFIRLWSV